jgi:branched-chain amino acid transport system substrate-binding protein
MKIGKKGLSYFVLLIFLSLFLVSSPVQAKDSIRIGFSMALTGIYSQGAVSQMNAYQLWKEMVNEKGGIFVKDLGKKLPIEFIYYDDKSSADTAVKVYERLITRDRVDLVFTPWGTTIHFAIAALSERYKMPMVGNTASSVKLRDLPSKYFWFVTPSLADRQMQALVGLLESLAVKTVAIIYVQDLFPRENLQFLKPELKKANIGIIYEKDYPIGVKDLTTVLADIRAKNPDGLLALTYPADAFLLTGQIQGAQFNPSFLFLLIGPTIAAYGNAFGPVTEGIAAMGDWSPKLPWPGVKEFNERYINKFNSKPDYLDSIESYVSCQIIEQAIEMAGSLDKEKIRDAIAQNEFKTIRGPIRFKGTENVITPAKILQFQKGDLEIIWPSTSATAKPLYPKPPWPKKRK